MREARLPCCVPFCRRTVSVEKGFREWICGDHWRCIPAPTKKRWRTVQGRVRRITTSRPDYREYWLMPAGSPDRLSAVRMWRSHDVAWAAMKAAAIEAAAGLR